MGGEGVKELIFGPLGLVLRPKTRKTFVFEKIKKKQGFHEKVGQI